MKVFITSELSYYPLVLMFNCSTLNYATWERALKTYIVPSFAATVSSNCAQGDY